MTCERCPVCDGRGLVVSGFYRRDAYTPYSDQVSCGLQGDVMCRACLGKGIVWPAPTVQWGGTCTFHTVYALPGTAHLKRDSQDDLEC